MKIIYLMWIDWKWIYQRPQILAEGLEELYDVTVIFPRNLINRWKFQNNRYPKKYRKLYVAPFYDKSSIMSFFMDLSIRWSMRDIRKYDLAFVTYPIFEELIPEDFQGKIIYDCMDNHVALSGNSKRALRLASDERRLIQRADIVFSSSEMLKKKNEAFGIKSVLLRNGYVTAEEHKPQAGLKKKPYKLGYIGTISEWMDYFVIRKSLDMFLDIEYHFVGLVSGKGHLNEERVHYDGIVEHKDLYEHIKDFDCLIMPFIVNDIVLSVDPVKLYEYISYGKCIISVYYPEIERFRDFVYFYHDEAEYIKVLDDLMMKGFPPKYNEEQQKSFLKQNTWEERLKTIIENIEKLSG